jgi:hypothetical protein
MRHKHTDTQTDVVFMKYTVENGSGAMIYIPSFMNIGPGIQKLIRGIHRHTGWHKPHGEKQNSVQCFGKVKQ